jgi:acyl-CoA reductase-like NAD-dependent aldehyde dehydrogenase
MPLDVVPITTKGYLVNGEWHTQGTPVEIRSPYDQSVVATVVVAGRAELEQAIAAAVAAFETTRKMPSFKRQAILSKIAAEIRNRREEFSRAVALEAGKPIKTARAEVDRAIFTFQVAAEEATRIGGEYLPLDVLESTAGRWGMVRRFPLGPIAAITPFNFPLNLVAHKVAPAIAAGCTMVLKPAPQTPSAALMLGEAVEAAGWPAGALNVLPLSNEDAALLVSDDRLKMLSFTGSAPVGWQLKAASGKKKVVLELGGNAGVIIHSDADLDYAAERCATVGYGYAGQSCISVQRILVHRPAYERFLESFVGRVKKLKFGDPMEESTDVGPLIRTSDVDRAASWVEEAVQGGAKLVCGGKVHGTVMEPTVLTRTRPDMLVNCREVFAPVKTVEPYDEFDSAIAQVNGSPYGLQAGIFTSDVRLLYRAYEQLEVGGVIAGDVPTFRIDNMPYGGVKDSGLGREGLRYAIEEMTEPKLLVMNLR